MNFVALMIVLFYEGFSIFLCGRTHQAHAALPCWQSGRVHRTMRVLDDFVYVIHFLRDHDILLCWDHIIFCPILIYYQAR